MLKPVESAVLPPGALELGRDDAGGGFGIDLGRLIAGRLLIQGVSGAGKSWTLRRLLEQSAGRVQQIIIDPEGEFGAMAAEFGHVLVSAGDLNADAFRALAERLRVHRISAVIDLSESSREDQLERVAAFLAGLLSVSREHWYPVVVAIDEAHLFAPFGGAIAGADDLRKAAIGAVVDMMSRGRKRGIGGVLATQRLARLAKSVVSECQNFLIGLNTLDLDIKRAAETIGWTTRKASDRLPLLSPGDFVAVGPAFTRSPVRMRVGLVATSHNGGALALTPPPAISAEQGRELVQIDALMAESAAPAVQSEAAGKPIRMTKPRQDWSDDELRILRDNYQAGGAEAVLALLPHRSIGAIYTRAKMEGVTKPRKRAA